MLQLGANETYYRAEVKHPLLTKRRRRKKIRNIVCQFVGHDPIKVQFRDAFTKQFGNITIPFAVVLKLPYCVKYYRGNVWFSHYTGIRVK